MTDNRTTEQRISKPLLGFIKHQRNRGYIDAGQAQWLFNIADEIDAKYEQAIAATLGSGTCEDLGGIGANGEVVFHCSKCGCILSLFDSDGMNTLCTSFICDYPRFCPECGRKVVSA